MYGIDLTFVSFFFNVAADSELCTARVVDDYGEAASVTVPAQDQAMLKSKRRQIFKLTVKEGVERQAEKCNERRKGIAVYSLFNAQFQIIREC